MQQPAEEQLFMNIIKIDPTNKSHVPQYDIGALLMSVHFDVHFDEAGYIVH